MGKSKLEEFFKPDKGPEVKITIRVPEDDLKAILKSIRVTGKDDKTPTEVATASFQMAAKMARAEQRNREKIKEGKYSEYERCSE